MLKDNIHTEKLRSMLVHLKHELEYWEGIQLEKEMDIKRTKVREKNLSECKLWETELLKPPVPYTWEAILKKQEFFIKKIARLRKKIQKIDKHGTDPQLPLEQT